MCKISYSPKLWKVAKKIFSGKDMLKFTYKGGFFTILFYLDQSSTRKNYTLYDLLVTKQTTL